MKQMGSKRVSEDRHMSLLSVGLTIGVSCVLIMFFPSASAFTRRYVTRFCYTSPNTAQILSQCVLCDYFAFPSTLLGCTGSTALTTNMTATQALCVINGCFGQVQQVPSFSGGGVPSIGRKKRDDGEENTVDANENDKENLASTLANKMSAPEDGLGLEASAIEDVKIVKSVTVNLDLDGDDDFGDDTDA